MEKTERKGRSKPGVERLSPKTHSGPDFRAVVDRLPDGILIHGDRQILFANPCCVRLLGAETAEQLVGNDFSRFVKPEYMVAIRERLRDCHLTGEASAPLETTVIRCDGTLLDVEGVAIPIEWEGIQATEVVLRDISERNAAERALRDWQKRLQLAQKSGLRIGLWDWNISTGKISWSEGTYDAFGFTADCVPRTIGEFCSRVHPEDVQKFESALKPIVSGEVKECALRYRTVGERHDVHWMDAHGVMVSETHMIGVGVDVTTLVRSEACLRESEAKSLLLLNSTAEAIYGIDLDGTCTFCNPATVRLLGYESPADLIGKNMHHLSHHTRVDGSPYPAEECQIYAALREGRGNHLSSELLFRRDGSSFHAEYWSHPVFNAGVVVGAVVTFLDISERHRAEQALRDSEQKYRGLFDNACYGIFRSKTDGTLLDVNPAFVSTLGYDSREEMLKCNLRDIYFDPAVRDEVLKRLGRNETVIRELAWKRKDGQCIHVRVNGRRMLDPLNTGEFCFEGMIEDITERRTLEEQLRQAQKMEVVGRLAGGISHDFNNLLSVILGNAEMLIQNDPNSGTRRYVGEIQKATRRAAELTRQLLTFSNRQVLFPTVLNLNSVLRELTRMLDRVIGEKIHIDLILDGDLGSVKADRGQIEQILMNLGTNALDAMPEGGVLTFATENVESKNEYSPVKPGRYVKLSVRDTGFGMTEDIKARVFDPFFTTKPQGHGTGLGLATVYGIVEQSDGYIWVHSSAGKGSTFEIWLPRVEAVPSRSRPEDLNLPSFHNRNITVLLLEDEEALREITVNSLNSRGINTLSAATGHAAVEVAARHTNPISLIISDVVLPDIPGPSAVERMRAHHPEAKVLYMSGYADKEAAAAVAAQGGTLLQKPVTRLELLRNIEEALRPESCPPM